MALFVAVCSAVLSLTASLASAQMYRELSPRPVLTVEAGRVPSPPAVDGELSDWGDVRRIPFSEGGPHVSTPGDFRLHDDGATEPDGTTRTNQDLSGSFAVQWDDDFVYLAAWVIDNAIDLDGRDDFEWWRKDSVSLFLDVPRDGDGSDWQRGDHAFSFLADPARQPGSAWWRHGDGGRQESPAPETVRWGVRLQDRGYAVEAAVPMAILGQFTPDWKPPYAGRTAGFMFIATDPDNGPDTFGGELIYGGSNDDDGDWAALRFVEPPTAPPRQESARVRQVQRALQLAPGWRAEIYALVPDGPNRMAWHDDGRLFMTVGGWGPGGEVVVAEDVDGDGAADRTRVYLGGLDTPLGLTLRGDDLFLAHRTGSNRVSLVRDTDGDGRGEIVRHLITGLNGGHGVGHVAFGPDGRLYVGTGSTGDLIAGSHPFAAGIFRMNPDGTGAELVAGGLRNPYGFDWDAAGRLFATDNGPNKIAVPYNDELNYIVPGRHYGFPTVYTQPDRTGEFAPPAFRFAENASADGIAFYDGDRFPELRDDAFVAIWGPADPNLVDLVNNPRPPWDAYYVARVEIADTAVTRVTRFAGDFQHPVDVSVGPDGALYVADWGSTGRSGDQSKADGDGAVFRIVRDAATAVVEDASAPTPRRFALGAGYPNPFNSSVSIPFALDLGGQVDLAVYNAAGQRVRTLVGGWMPPGAHQAVWDGLDDGGRQLATGVYLCGLRTAGGTEARKLLLLR